MNYKINEKYIKDLIFPIFITNFTKKVKIFQIKLEYGSFNWLKYAYDNGCPLSDETATAVC